jgi:hypothetical protein
MQKLCGRGSCWNLPGGRTSDEADVATLRSGSFGNQNANAYARHRRCYEEMAQHTRVGRSIGMVMPHGSERGSEQQHEECYRDHDTQGSLWVSHF